MIQISVKIADRPGELERVVKSLGDEKVDIKALYLSTAPEQSSAGQVRMIVTNPPLAMRVLESIALEPVQERVLVVELEDNPGGLARVLKVLSTEEINVKYAYGFVTQVERRALSILGVTELERATEALKKEQFSLVDHTTSPTNTYDISAYLGGEWYW